MAGRFFQTTRIPIDRLCLFTELKSEQTFAVPGATPLLADIVDDIAVM